MKTTVSSHTGQTLKRNSTSAELINVTIRLGHRSDHLHQPGPRRCRRRHARRAHLVTPDYSPDGSDTRPLVIGQHRPSPVFGQPHVHILLRTLSARGEQGFAHTRAVGTP